MELLTNQQRYLSTFKYSLISLNEAIIEYNQNHSDVIRDGTIHRFEFCTDMSLKATSEFLVEQGYTKINSPKSIMKQAYADYLIDDEYSWLSILDDRRLTSHLYDDNTANEIFERIQTVYLTVFNRLIEKLSA